MFRLLKAKKYMADELIDVVDQNNRHLNIQKMKSEVHELNLWHRASHIWIYNSKGELLLQLRAKNKKLYPNKWDISVAGHVMANEEPVVSALREISEETGLSVDTENLEFIQIRKKVNNGNNKVNEFYYVYLLKFDGDINHLRLCEEEVEKVDFFPIAKIEQELRGKHDKYFPHGNYWFDTISKIKERIDKP